MAVISNQATLSYNGVTVNSNVATGEITELLTVTKSVFPETYGAGDNLTYVINVINMGTDPVTGVSISDNLGEYSFADSSLYPLTYIDGTAKVYENGEAVTYPITVEQGPPLVISGITLPAGGNVSVVYTATANSSAPLGPGGQIENAATVDGTGIPSATAGAIATAENAPELTITKSISPSIVRESGTLTYTFLIQNLGAAAAVPGDRVKVTDVLDPVLTGLSATLNGVPMTVGTDYTYSETDGVFETVEGVITVPAASFTQDTTTGAWITTPGETTLTISGNVL